ncbi:MAG TPA: DUF5615 family PIN-like protein [Pyrinomonadaceae bacterium]|nr:DUF5615 family PIN-like protein [Pyrinomonadaceae bacterium]
MRILLDENMRRKSLTALTSEGHEVDSIQSLQMQGIDNGALYEFAATNYDLCFTRDAEFSRRVQSRPVTRLKLVHVIIPQTRQDELTELFLLAFRETDWTTHKSGEDWPGAVV